MDRKKELKLHYKETNTVEAGVYLIENKQNGKVFIASTRNFKTLNGARFMLKNNTHNNKSLQQDWNTFGADQFTIDRLEKLNKEDLSISEKEALLLMEEKWLEQYKDRLYVH